MPEKQVEDVSVNFSTSKLCVLLIAMASFFTQSILVKLKISGKRYDFLDGVMYVVGDPNPISHDHIYAKKCVIVSVNMADSFLLFGVFWYCLFVSKSQVIGHHIVFLGTIYLYFFLTFMVKHTTISDDQVFHFANIIVLALVAVFFITGFLRRNRQGDTAAFVISTAACVYFFSSRFLLELTDQFVSL